MTESGGERPARSVTNADLRIMQLELLQKVDGIAFELKNTTLRIDERLRELTEHSNEQRVTIATSTSDAKNMRESSRGVEGRVVILEERVDGVTGVDIIRMIAILPKVERLVEIIGHDQQMWVARQAEIARAQAEQLAEVAKSRQSDKPMILLTAATTVAVLGGVIVPLLLRFFG